MLTLVCSIAGFLAVKYIALKLSVAFADGQVKIFEDMKAAASGTTDPQKLSEQLKYVINYYPSGSKQAIGTQLDRIVETARSNAVAAIIFRLRATTGKDLGSDSWKWLKEYPPSEH